MIVNDDVCIGDIEKDIKQCSGKMLEEIKLFDVYKGSQIEEGKKICGVCGGIAEYFDIDPVVVRVGFTILILCFVLIDLVLLVLEPP